MTEDRKIKEEAGEKQKGVAAAGEKSGGDEKNRAAGKEQEYYNQLLRLKAEFENYRKRIEKEKPELVKWGKAEIILKFLPLYDLLLKAHSHIKNIGEREKEMSNEIGEVLSGIEMIFTEFSRVFKSEGIREIKPKGKLYDPMTCEIVGVVEGNEENDRKVVEELEKGYFYEDKVLRPSKVKIAKKAEGKEEKKEDKEKE